MLDWDDVSHPIILYFNHIKKLKKKNRICLSEVIRKQKIQREAAAKYGV